MAEVRFFHQERADGGKRSGLWVDGEQLLQAFTPGSEEHDPMLLWYTDVALSTDIPPTSRGQAVAWFQENADSIRAGLEGAAERLATGLDVDLIPWEFETDTRSGHVKVSVNAMKRFTALDIAGKLRELSASVPARVLPAMEPVG